MAVHLPADVNLNSPQIKLIQEWDQGFKDKNLDILDKYLHKDFHREVYPRSMGQPTQNKEDWLRDMTRIMRFATGIETTVHSVIEAPGKVVTHATTELKNTAGLDTAHEVIWTMHIGPDEDGSLKIKQIDDFRDSKVYLELSKAMGEAMQANR